MWTVPRPSVYFLLPNDSAQHISKESVTGKEKKVGALRAAILGILPITRGITLGKFCWDSKGYPHTQNIYPNYYSPKFGQQGSEECLLGSPYNGYNIICLPRGLCDMGYMKQLGRCLALSNFFVVLLFPLLCCFCQDTASDNCWCWKKAVVDSAFYHWTENRKYRAKVKC